MIKQNFWILSFSAYYFVTERNAYVSMCYLYHVAIPTDVSLLSLSAGGKAARRVCNV